MLVTQAYRFALDPTPAQKRKLASHAGAARFAYNFGLALVKELLGRRAGGEHVEVPWTPPALRREWNTRKREIAPWWAENSKEAASCGLADLAAGLKAFSGSKHGRRAGSRIGFPRFKRRGRARESFRYTTGRFGVCGRTRVQLPRIGLVRTHEPTTKLARKLDRGEARVLSATVSREGDRWFCSLCCEVQRADPMPGEPDAVLGVDVGVRHLAVLSTGEQVHNPPSDACAATSASSIASVAPTTATASTSAVARSTGGGRRGDPAASGGPRCGSPVCTRTRRTFAATGSTSSPAGSPQSMARSPSNG